MNKLTQQQKEQKQKEYESYYDECQKCGTSAPKDDLKECNNTKYGFCDYTKLCAYCANRTRNHPNDSYCNECWKSFMEIN